MRKGRSGPTKESRKELVIMLEKHAKKSKKRIWKILAEGISKPARGKGEINLWQLGKLAKKFEGKVMVTSSKVLSFGDAEKKLRIAAPEFSGMAREKIKKNGGEAMSLSGLMESAYKEKEMVLVK